MAHRHHARTRVVARSSTVLRSRSTGGERHSGGGASTASGWWPYSRRVQPTASFRKVAGESSVTARRGTATAGCTPDTSSGGDSAPRSERANADVSLTLDHRNSRIVPGSLGAVIRAHLSSVSTPDLLSGARPLKPCETAAALAQLEKTAVFLRCTPAERTRLAEGIMVAAACAGDLLLTEGACPARPFLAFVARGAVALCVHVDSDGGGGCGGGSGGAAVAAHRAEVELATLAPPGCFGQGLVMGEVKAIATVRAHTDALLYLLPKAAIDAVRSAGARAVLDRDRCERRFMVERVVRGDMWDHLRAEGGGCSDGGSGQGGCGGAGGGADGAQQLRALCRAKKLRLVEFYDEVQEYHRLYAGRDSQARAAHAWRLWDTYLSPDRAGAATRVTTSQEQRRELELSLGMRARGHFLSAGPAWQRHRVPADRSRAAAVSPTAPSRPRHRRSVVVHVQHSVRSASRRARLSLESAMGSVAAFSRRRSSARGSGSVRLPATGGASTGGAGPSAAAAGGGNSTSSDTVATWNDTTEDEDVFESPEGAAIFDGIIRDSVNRTIAQDVIPAFLHSPHFHRFMAVKFPLPPPPAPTVAGQGKRRFSLKASASTDASPMAEAASMPLGWCPLSRYYYSTRQQSPLQPQALPPPPPTDAGELHSLFVVSGGRLVPREQASGGDSCACTVM